MKTVKPTVVSLLVLFAVGCGNPEQEMVAISAAMPPQPMPAMVSGNYASMSAPVQSFVNTETYVAPDDNPVLRASEHPVSTFSIDVDTGSYANVRRFLNDGSLPPADAVRVEEMVNYFSYDYAGPKDQKTPFKASTEVAPTPWNKNTLLMRIGIKAFDVEAAKRPAANLVFLLDVSGSMGASDKLPLLKSAFKLLTEKLTAKDTVAIVVYAGAAGVVLQPTPGDQKATIRAALDQLEAGGSTNGGEGIELAYALALQSFIEGGINRVIMATDGDMNVGTASFEGLLDMIEKRRQSGISLTTLGFGQGNINDHLLEQAADKGNGNYSYIDSLSEARKVLVEELSSTLQIVASDVKIQVEFNPATVAEYRLIGYENRMLREEDFTNDKVDAGDIGAGHTVTALYEIALVGSKGLRLEARRYEAPQAVKPLGDELAFVRLRYKLPGEDKSIETSFPFKKSKVLKSFDAASPSTRFATSVAAFAQILKGSRYTEDMTLEQVIELARAAKGKDEGGYRSEFLRLVDLAAGLRAGLGQP